jgi:hypothetical protein
LRRRVRCHPFFVRDFNILMRVIRRPSLAVQKVLPVLQVLLRLENPSEFIIGKIHQNLT